MTFPRSYVLIIALTLASVLGGVLLLRPSPAPPIRIGVLHTHRGTLAGVERPLVGAVRLAVEEIAEVGLKAIGPVAFHPNHYAVWRYFQSLTVEANQRFVAAFQQRYGADRVTSDPVEATYVGMRLWAQAVRDAGTDAPEQVNRALSQQSTAAPSRIAAVDRDTRHLWKQVHIGKALANGQFELTGNSGESLRPAPFPDYHSRLEWHRLATEQFGARP